MGHVGISITHVILERAGISQQVGGSQAQDRRCLAYPISHLTHCEFSSASFSFLSLYYRLTLLAAQKPSQTLATLTPFQVTKLAGYVTKYHVEFYKSEI